MMRKWEYARLVVAGFFITVGIGIALEGHIFAERTFGIGSLVAIFGMMLINHIEFCNYDTEQPGTFVAKN
ncbi:MAG: hypothetical protein ACFFBU_03650 [Promethearchaeota archaeon]